MNALTAKPVDDRKLRDQQKALERKRLRVNRVNEFISVIASCGRRFFSYQERVSSFEVDDKGRLWFLDAYSQTRIYTHNSGKWRGFTNGGTLRTLIEDLRDYIRTGDSPNLNIGPWPKHLCDGDLWGYGDAMQQVRTAAENLK